MNEWTILPNKFILDANSTSKLIGKYVTKIVYLYDQAFKVGVMVTNMALPMQKIIFSV